MFLRKKEVSELDRLEVQALKKVVLSQAGTWGGGVENREEKGGRETDRERGGVREREREENGRERNRQTKRGRQRQTGAETDIQTDSDK